MKHLIIFIYIFGIFSSCNNSEELNDIAVPKPKLSDEAKFFWDNLNELCGSAFEGENIISPKNDSTFLGKTLIIHFIRCDSSKVEAAFHVEDDRSRILQISNNGSFLELRHQHTNENGELSEKNFYGGETLNQGLYNAQFFPANQHTAEMIPAAAGNIWWLELEPDESFTYHMFRVGTDRKFSFEFDISKSVENRESPWGWKN